jgi:hypothetical protein
MGVSKASSTRFSVTVTMDSKVSAAIAAIAAIPPSRHRPGPRSATRTIWDDQLGCWVSDAQVAEVEYTAFTSAKKGQAITDRLIVRRVRDLNREAPAGQDELFPAWRYHAVFTDSPVELVQAEEQHRDHAIVEQVFADCSDGPLAHLPSGPSPRTRPGWPAPPSRITCCAPGESLASLAYAVPLTPRTRCRASAVPSSPRSGRLRIR